MKADRSARLIRASSSFGFNYRPPPPSFVWAVNSDARRKQASFLVVRRRQYRPALGTAYAFPFSRSFAPRSSTLSRARRWLTTTLGPQEPEISAVDVVVARWPDPNALAFESNNHPTKEISLCFYRSGRPACVSQSSFVSLMRKLLGFPP